MLFWREMAKTYGFESCIKERKVWVGLIEFHIDYEERYRATYNGIRIWSSYIRDNFADFLKVYSEQSKKGEITEESCLVLLKILFKGESDDTFYWKFVFEVFLKSKVGIRYSCRLMDEGTKFYDIDKYEGSFTLHRCNEMNVVRLTGILDREIEYKDNGIDLGFAISGVKRYICIVIERLVSKFDSQSESIHILHHFMRSFRQSYKDKFIDWFDDNAKTIKIGEKCGLMYFKFRDNNIKLLVEPYDSLGVNPHTIMVEGWVTKYETEDGYKYYTIMECVRGRHGTIKQYVYDWTEVKRVQDTLW